MLIKPEKLFTFHLVVGPEEPAPITILNFVLLKFLLKSSILSFLIKNWVSVGQFLIFYDFSVNVFAALIKCKFFFLKIG